MTAAERARGLGAAAALALALAGCGGTPSAAWLSGRVVGPDGEAIAGAVVSDARGRGSTLSQADGRFRLALPGAAEGADLTATKPGRAPATARVAPGRAGTLTLEETAAADPPRVYLDPAFEGEALRPALSALEAEGALLPAAKLEDAELAWLACPDAGLDARRYERFARAGGRVWLFGEWGGYAVGGAEAANALAGPAGLRFTGATARAPGEASADAPLRLVPALPPLGGGTALTAFMATTVAVGPGGLALAPLPAGAYGIQQVPLPRPTEREAFAAAGALGHGAIVAFGDTSGWRAEDSLADGTPNWQRGANLPWLAALLRF